MSESKKVKYHRVTTSEAREIRELLNDHSVRETNGITGRSETTIRRIKNMSSSEIDNIDIRMIENQKKRASSRKAKETTQTPKKSLTYNLAFFDNSVFSCGLISNRHDIPCKNYIFQRSFNPALMFDYKRQEDVVERFFRNFRITSEKTLVVYLTGLQTALCTVVNVCAKHKISLICMHYNKDTDDWHAQKILEFKNSNSWSKENPHENYTRPQSKKETFYAYA